MFAIVDHFEPDWGDAELSEQLTRVDRWVEMFPKLVGAHRDSDDRPPQCSFFYPAEVYQSQVLERLAELCQAGFGEVEVHLHHDGDTAATLRAKLEQAKTDFTRHGFLARTKGSQQVRFGFVHGNWALDNSRSDGKWCGVNNELDVLVEAGCYADFTLPSAPSDTQTHKINSLYYAAEDPTNPKSHDRGRDVSVGTEPNGDLLMVQGPLTLDWGHRKYGVFPRIENGELSAHNPPSNRRVDLWVNEAIGIQGREDWIFVKVYTHGAKPDTADVLLGPQMDEMLTYLEQAYNEGSRYQLHYVTAREMVNIIQAGQAGLSGSPGQYRDYSLIAGEGRP